MFSRCQNQQRIRMRNSPFCLSSNVVSFPESGFLYSASFYGRKPAALTVGGMHVLLQFAVELELRHDPGTELGEFRGFGSSTHRCLKRSIFKQRPLVPMTWGHTHLTGFPMVGSGNAITEITICTDSPQKSGSDILRHTGQGRVISLLSVTAQ